MEFNSFLKKAWKACLTRKPVNISFFEQKVKGAKGAPDKEKWQGENTEGKIK
jgi:hypothetical protein